MRGVIVGCGIAGPVLGMFLKKVGIDSVICEARSAQQLSQSAFLGIAPNGMNVLASLGLAGQVRAVGHVSRGFCFLNARGKLIGEICQHEDEAQYGEPMVMIKRADLHKILLQAAETAGVPLSFDAPVTSIAQAADQVTVTCRNGQLEQADFVVGCDGLRSRTRELLFPGAPAPAYEGLLDFAGFTQALGDEPLTTGWNSMVFGARSFFGAFVTADREVWWFHNGGQPEPVFDMDEATARARLLAEHRQDPAWISALIDRTARILGPWPLHVLGELDSWHQGRVCLIGDAAHATTPSSGQGASLAMEDAMVLALALRDLGQPQRAFARLRQLRGKRVREIAVQARRHSSGKTNASAMSSWLRDRMLATFLKLGAGAQRRVQAYRVEWT